jgi:hypothetical protein
MTIAASAGILVTAQLASSPDLLNAVYLAWALPVVAYLGVVTLGPARRRAALAPAAA